MSEKISINPLAKFSEGHSSMQDTRFVFTYKIKITNLGNNSVQLLSRHWKITDANGDIQEVQGDGVVGEQPLIAPTDIYQYDSFCMLSTPLGWMEGYYKMRKTDGDIFDAKIPRFILEMPGIMQ